MTYLAEGNLTNTTNSTSHTSAVVYTNPEKFGALMIIVLFGTLGGFLV